MTAMTGLHLIQVKYAFAEDWRRIDCADALFTILRRITTQHDISVVSTGTQFTFGLTCRRF